MFDSVFFHLTIELLFGFIGLLIAVKIIGKRQVRQISPFDFVSAVVLGELLGNAIYNMETNILHILYGLAVWTVLLVLIEKIVQKSTKARMMIEGSPKLVIKNGQVDYQVLKKEKLDLLELTSLLRGQNTFSIREIEYAIIEPNGVITVIKKPEYQSVVKSDMNIAAPPARITLPLILDGKVDYNNLQAAEKDVKWLEKNLKKQNISRIEDVIYAEWNQNDGFYAQARQSTK
ncbi:MAG: DUF421 domain-containing protein [Christensenellaceae bacterium]|nr:DUF421 domain-containing protein [Christensenellaceae bacterium]